LRIGSGKTVVFELALLRFFSSELLHQGKDQLKPSLARAVREQQEQLDAIGDGDEIDMTASASAPTLMQKKKWQPKKAIYIAPLKSGHVQHLAACLSACLLSSLYCCGAHTARWLCAAALFALGPCAAV